MIRIALAVTTLIALATGALAQTQDERIAALERQVAALTQELATRSIQMRNPDIHSSLQPHFRNALDFKTRSGSSAGYGFGGGRAKAYLLGGLKLAEYGDTIDLGFGGGHYDAATGEELSRFAFGDAIAFLYAHRIVGPGKIEEGRSALIALKHGAIDLRASRILSDGTPAAPPKTVLTIQRPNEFANAWRDHGIGVSVGFLVGDDVRHTPILIGRPGELPPDAFVLYVKRPPM